MSNLILSGTFHNSKLNIMPLHSVERFLTDVLAALFHAHTNPAKGFAIKLTTIKRLLANTQL